MNACIYTVATGRYAKMAENLIASLRRNGIEHDFVAFSDLEVGGATETIKVKPMTSPEAYSAKVYLLSVMAQSKYEYVVLLDCDVVCRRYFSLDRFDGLACFALLEDDLESAKGTWHGVKLERVVSSFLAKNPDIGRPIHNLNGGFFGVRSEYCKEFVSMYEKVTEFPHSMEPGLAFAVLSMTTPDGLSFWDHKDLIAPSTHLPKSNGGFIYTAPFSKRKELVDPALVHLCFSPKEEPRLLLGRLD